MPSLLEALEAREAEVRGRLEELAGQVAGAQAELGRLVITRETVCALLEPALRPAGAGGDDRSAALFAPRRRTLPPTSGARLPEASLAALRVTVCLPRIGPVHPFLDQGNDGHARFLRAAGAPQGGERAWSPTNQRRQGHRITMAR